MRRDSRASQEADDRRAQEAHRRELHKTTRAIRELGTIVAKGGGTMATGLGAIAVAGSVITSAVREAQRLMEAGRRESAILVRAQAITGGTAQDVGAIAGQLRAIGIDREGMIQAAEQFRERVFSDPIAVGAFGRQVIPERFGGTESSIAVLREGLAILGRETTETARRIRAARLGLPKDVLEFFYASPYQQRRVLEAGEKFGGTIDPELRRLRADRAAQDARGQIASESAGNQIDKLWLRATNPIREISTRIREDAIAQQTGVPYWLRNRGQAAGAAPGTDSQTRATQENTKALYNLKEEFANSRRAGGAVPSGLRGQALQKALDEMGPNPYWLGAFSQH